VVIPKAILPVYYTKHFDFLCLNFRHLTYFAIANIIDLLLENSTQIYIEMSEGNSKCQLDLENYIIVGSYNIIVHHDFLLIFFLQFNHFNTVII